MEAKRWVRSNVASEYVNLGIVGLLWFKFQMEVILIMKWDIQL